MHRGTVVHRFGPFELDPATGRLFRGDSRMSLPDAQAAILRRLVAHAGQVVSKDALAEAGWGDVAVTDNSVKQAVSRLRRLLDAQQPGAVYIETIPNRGYRFAASVERSLRYETDTAPGVDLALFRAFVQGRRDLETLDRDAIRRARAWFAQVLSAQPDHALAHVGMGFACALAFESTYWDTAIDPEALTLAVHHARQGTTLAPASGEAWSTLALALSLDGEREDAAAAAWKAVVLEPDAWRHRLLLGYVTWGEERLRAARTVLTLCPGTALAHWLIATVLVARGAFDAALEILRDGCAAQASLSVAARNFPAVGLHLLRGLVLAAQDRLDAATEELMCELSSMDPGQLYARGCATNTWYALGAVRLRQRRREEAESAFREALAVAPGHLASAAALGRALPVLDPADPRAVDAAIAGAVRLARAGRHADAAAAYRDAIVTDPFPGAGWILPVEPLLHPAVRPDIWHDVLVLVRQRAM